MGSLVGLRLMEDGLSNRDYYSGNACKNGTVPSSIGGCPDLLRRETTIVI